MESAARHTDGCQYDHVDRHGVENLITGQDIARVDRDREKIIFTLTGPIRERSLTVLRLSRLAQGRMDVKADNISRAYIFKPHCRRHIPFPFIVKHGTGFHHA